MELLLTESDVDEYRVLDMLTKNPGTTIVATNDDNSDIIPKLAYLFVRLFTSTLPLNECFNSTVTNTLAAFPVFSRPNERIASGRITQLHTLQSLLTQSEWSVSSLRNLHILLQNIQDPRLRQQSLHFAYDVVHHCVTSSSSDNLAIQVCMDILLLGITDVWSAVRKESAKQISFSVCSFPTIEYFNTFMDKLLTVATRRETDNEHAWKAQEGAILALSALISNIKMVPKDTLMPPAHDTVQSTIKPSTSEPAIPVVVYNIGDKHSSIPNLPRVLITKLKPVLYAAVKHDQLSLREAAAQCLIKYMDICEPFTRILLFQEVMSKLNRLAVPLPIENLQAPQELLDAAEAEGLLDVLAKLVPLLPTTFLVKHWKIVFPTLERYVMHIASSVRQKSSAVVLALAEISLSPGQDNVDLDLLLQMMVAIAEPTSEEVGVCWQQLEGRLLSIDVLINLLGINYLTFKSATLTNHGDAPREVRLVHAAGHRKNLRFPPDRKYRGWLTDGTIPNATWTVVEKDTIYVPQQSIVERMDAYISSRDQVPNQVWGRILSGWVVQTQRAWTSSQFELRRISKQVLPGLVRLCLWRQQLPCITEASSMFSNMAMDTRADSKESLENNEQEKHGWLWQWLRCLLLHLEFVREATDDHEDKLLESVLVQGRAFAKSALETKVYYPIGEQGDDTETVVARVEVLIFAALTWQQDDQNDLLTKWLKPALIEVYTHINPIFQLTDHEISVPCKRRDSSTLDRSFSISLVQFLPHITQRLLHWSLEQTYMWSLKVTIRIATSWLASDDMFRWITVDKITAQTAILECLCTLTTTSSINKCRDLSFWMNDLMLVERTVADIWLTSVKSPRLRDELHHSIVGIYVALWTAICDLDQNADVSPKCHSQHVAQHLVDCINQRLSDQHEQVITTTVKETADHNSWDDWDDSEESSVNGKSLELRPSDVPRDYIQEQNTEPTFASWTKTLWSQSHKEAFHAMLRTFRSEIEQITT